MFFRENLQVVKFFHFFQLKLGPILNFLPEQDRASAGDRALLVVPSDQTKSESNKVLCSDVEKPHWLCQTLVCTNLKAANNLCPGLGVADAVRQSLCLVKSCLQECVAATKRKLSATQNLCFFRLQRKHLKVILGLRAQVAEDGSKSETG